MGAKVSKNETKTRHSKAEDPERGIKNVTIWSQLFAKRVFQIHSVDDRVKAVLKRALKRAQMLPVFVNLPPCLIGMEACVGVPITGLTCRSSWGTR